MIFVVFNLSLIHIYADTFLEVGSKLLERFEKQPVFLAEAEIGILDLFGRNV